MAKEVRKDRAWIIACHLSALIGFIGVPLGNLLGPLVVWLLKRNELPAVDEHGKAALNFQLSMTIYGIAACLLIFVLIGIPLLIALAITDVVLVIMAAVKASNDQPFKYPLTIQLIK